MNHYLVFETPRGFCGIAWTRAGITCLRLPTKGAEAAERTLRRRVPDAEFGAPTPAVAEAVVVVRRYFEGEETDFSRFELDLDGQEGFFTQVYAAARRVGWGQTTTYGALAKEVGAAPEAARDVGHAMARNPVPLIIPCHRVLAAGGRIGGFSAPGGSAAKMRMLELEGFHVEQPRPARQADDAPLLQWGTTTHPPKLREAPVRRRIPWTPQAILRFRHRRTPSIWRRPKMLMGDDTI